MQMISRANNLKQYVFVFFKPNNNKEPPPHHRAMKSEKLKVCKIRSVSLRATLSKRHLTG